MYIQIMEWKANDRNVIVKQTINGHVIKSTSSITIT
jgi:hypothetical protein